MDAVVDGTNLATSFAITVASAPPSPALSAEAARALIDDAAVAGQPGPIAPLLHGPFYLPPGTQIASAGPIPPKARSFPIVTERANWFFWIDHMPGAEFAHPTGYVLLDSSDTSGELTDDNSLVAGQQWWPDIILPGGDQIYELIQPSVVRRRRKTPLPTPARFSFTDRNSRARKTTPRPTATTSSTTISYPPRTSS